MINPQIRDEIRLWQAVHRGDIDEARRVLDTTGVDPNTPGLRMGYGVHLLAWTHPETNTLLVAVACGYIDIAKLLVDRGATPADSRDVAQLYGCCAARDDAPMLRFLLEAGVLESSNQGVLSWRQKIKSWRYIIHRGSTQLLRVGLEHAVATGTISRFLNDATRPTPLPATGVVITPANAPYGRPLLHYAVSAECTNAIAKVQVLLEYGAQVFARDRFGRTAEDVARLSRNEDDPVITMLKAEAVTRNACVMVALGHHPRVGAGSVIASMDPELLRMMLELVSRHHEPVFP